ncbi:MAG: type I restriction enzyme HsdR N-terminal domain-containing protein [Paludibacteraceae bacterium]|nr:type I restriction enzyme HsdR N-terminal domain-containing protein [Paludibacteraceae bacterium]
MEWQPRIQTVRGRECILCPWRRRWVKLTPEEWVRQQVLWSLETCQGYPHGRMAVEHSITVGDCRKRCDAVVFSPRLQPLCIIEFKQEQVPLGQRVLDQVAVYNRRLQVPFFIVSNGRTTSCCRVTDEGYAFLDHIPSYSELLTP